MFAPWRIELFGGLRARQSGRVVTRFRTQKTAVLLGYLAHHRGQMHSREVLVELLWPGREPDAGRNNLSTALSSLRRQLESPEAGPGTVILADRNSVGLNPESVSVDVAEFEAGLRAAREMKRGPRRSQALSDAVELYTGEFLAGFYDDWILLEQRRLAEACYQAIAELTASLEQEGDLAAALRCAWRGVRVDRLREDAYRNLMRLYSATGQPEQAFRQYRELEATLARELRSAPSAETRALLHSIERQPRARPAGDAAESPRTTESAAQPVTLPPTGTVTFLLADALDVHSESVPDAPGAGDAWWAQPVGAEVRRYGGLSVGTDGGVFTGAFGCANDALACALSLHRALAERRAHGGRDGGIAPERGWLRVALDTGQVETRGGRYHSSALPQARRILLAAHPGQILCSERTATLAQFDLDPSVLLIDVGRYRLRGGIASERLFQAGREGTPGQDFPAPKAPASRPGTLPVPLTRFIGRRDECDAVVGLFARQCARLVTLTGPAGCGKTRLAVEAARLLGERMPGGAWFVEAADIPSAALVTQAIRDTLGLPGLSRADPLRQVADALNGQHALLILDNIDHLVPEAAGVVQALLETTPGLSCLCTSRRRLHVAGEREVVVLPLPVPTGEQDPGRIASFDSVRLFADRAQAAQPDFRVTRGNAGAVAALCARLDGIPLALELAAARAQVLTPAQMLARLGQRLDIPEGASTGHVRRPALRAAIDWSYCLLSPSTQRFIERLSVFRGGCDLAAAQEVCQEPLALDLLTQLRGLSLVQSEVDRPEARFRLLDTVRRFASSRLPPHERPALARRHAGYYLALAEATVVGITGPDQLRCLERLSTEHENFRSILGWGLDGKGDLEAAARLAALLWPFWYARGHATEGRQWLARAIEQAPDAPLPVRARLLVGAGVLADVQGDPERSVPLCMEGLALCRDAGDAWGAAVSLTVLGLAALALRDVERAESLHGEALQLARAADSPWSAAFALCGLADCAFTRGDYIAVRTLTRDALAQSRMVGDGWLTAWALGTDGMALAALGHPGHAAARYRESLSLFREIGDDVGVLSCLEAVAAVVVQTDPERAMCLLSAASALRERLGVTPQGNESEAREASLAAAREALGSDAFAAGWARGRDVSIDQAVALVFEGA